MDKLISDETVVNALDSDVIDTSYVEETKQSRPVRNIKASNIISEYDIDRQSAVEEILKVSKKQKRAKNKIQDSLVDISKPQKENDTPETKNRTSRRNSSSQADSKKKLDFSNRSKHKTSTNTKKKSEVNDFEVFATIGTELNNDICDTCGDGGDLLCCDNCPCAFHFYCINPPVDDSDLPEGDWYCNSCEYSLNGKNNRVESKGKLSSVLNYLLKENPKEFFLPPSIKKNEYEAKSEYKMMDILELIAIPSTAAYRYTPLEDKSDIYRKRKVSTCTYCHGEEGEVIKCTQCKKYYHKWCLEPPYYDTGDNWMCGNCDTKKLKSIVQSPLITQKQNFDVDDEFEDLLHFGFERKFLPSFLVKPVEEIVIVSGKDDSDDEFVISSRRRNQSPNAIVVGSSDTGLHPKSKNVDKLSQRRTKNKELTPQDLDRRTKKWCLKKMRVEQELLINQLSQFVDFCSSSAQHKSKMIQNLSQYQPIIPREVDISEESVFANYVKNMDKKQLIQRKDIDASMLLSNIDDDMLLFLARQRINQIFAQKNFHSQFPKKKSKSKSVMPKSDSDALNNNVDIIDIKKSNSKKKRDQLENFSFDHFEPAMKIRKELEDLDDDDDDIEIPLPKDYQSVKVSPTNKLKIVISTNKPIESDEIEDIASDTADVEINTNA